MGKVATTQKLTNDHFKYCQFIIDWSQSTYNVSSKSKLNIRLVGWTIISTSVCLLRYWFMLVNHNIAKKLALMQDGWKSTVATGNVLTRSTRHPSFLLYCQSKVMSQKSSQMKKHSYRHTYHNKLTLSLYNYRSILEPFVVK